MQFVSFSASTKIEFITSIDLCNKLAQKRNLFISSKNLSVPQQIRCTGKGRNYCDKPQGNVAKLSMAPDKIETCPVSCCMISLTINTCVQALLWLKKKTLQFNECKMLLTISSCVKSEKKKEKERMRNQLNFRKPAYYLGIALILEVFIKRKSSLETQAIYQ